MKNGFGEIAIQTYPMQKCMSKLPFCEEMLASSSPGLYNSQKNPRGPDHSGHMESPPWEG